MDPLYYTRENTTTTQQNFIFYSGVVIWSVCILFGLRMILGKCLPYITVEEGEAMIVERMSKYNRTITRGTHLLIPFWETLRPVVWSYDDRKEGPVSFETCRIMTRKTKLELSPIKALTNDSQRVSVVVNLVFIIQDVKHVVYHGNNLYGTLQKMITKNVKESIQSFPIDKLTLDTLQDALDVAMDAHVESFEKRGVMKVECKLVDIKYPTTLVEKRERLEEVELQQELEERLSRQRSEMIQKELRDILKFCKDHNLDNVIQGKMLASVIHSNHL